MIRVVELGDIHLNGGLYGDEPGPSGHSRSSESTHAIFMEACERTAAEADALLVLGDLWKDGDPPAEYVEMYSDGFSVVHKSGKEIVVIPGNHEWKGILDARFRNALAHFFGRFGIRYQVTPGVVILKCGLQVACLPWPTSAQYLSRGEADGLSMDGVDKLVALKACDAIDAMADEVEKRGGPSVLIGHATVGDAVLGSAKRGSEVVMGKLLSEPVLPAEAVDRAPFLAADFAHLHSRQRFSKNGMYVGAPNRFDFGEEDQKKAYSLRSFDESTMTSTVQDIATDARVFRTIEIGADSGPEEVVCGPGEWVRLLIEEDAAVRESEARALLESQGGFWAYTRVLTKPSVERARRAVKDDMDVACAFDRWLEVASGIEQEQWPAKREALRRFVASVDEAHQVAAQVVVEDVDGDPKSGCVQVQQEMVA